MPIRLQRSNARWIAFSSFMRRAPFRPSNGCSAFYDSIIANCYTISNSQKRGEWEPVLRHSVNLKVEEEMSGSQRQVTTFFIADEFDANTINIWKAIAAVPMQSSIEREIYTDNVVIMPINSDELCVLMDQADKYNEIIKNVHALFEVEKRNFDLNWREDFMTKMTL